MLAPFLALLMAQSPPPVTAAPDEWGRSVQASSRVLGGSLNYYFSVDDYPAAAMRAEAQGAVRFRLAIAPDGRVANCVVTRSSGSAALDRNTCGILGRRIRYDRFVHLRGRRLPTSDRGIVRWGLAADRRRQRYPDLVPPPHGWNFELECRVPFAC